MPKKYTPPALRGIRLIQLMQWGRQYEAREIKDELGIEPRSLHNYITQLREAGYKIESKRGAQGAYWLEAGEEMHPLSFEPEELKTLVVALATLLTTAPEDDPLYTSARKLYNMITYMMLPAAVEECRAEERAITRELMMMRAVWTVHQQKKS